MARNKSKKNSILNFVAVAILTIVGLVLSFCSFDIPYSSQHFNGFANSISLGMDLGGGTAAVYDCTLTDDSETRVLDRAIEETIDRLESVIGTRCPEAKITRQGDSQIRIEVSSDEESENVLSLLGEPTSLRMTAEENGEARLTGADIANVVASYQDGNYGVVLIFDDEGAEKFAELTSEVASDNGGSGTLYVYIGDQSLSLTVKSVITENSTFISGSFETLEDAENYALQIISGTFNVSMERVQQANFSATLGENALTYFLIGGAVAVVLIMVLMWLRYGDFGFLASFSFVIYMVLMLFFLQAIPLVQLTLAGHAGIVLSVIMLVAGNVTIFEKIREEYRSGKKIPLSVKSGFKRSFWAIFDSNILLIIVSIVLLIFGTYAMQGFATTLLIGTVLALFMNLVALRFFTKWYLPFNSVNGKKLHLPKQTKHFKENAEIKNDEVKNDEVEVLTQTNIGGQAND